MSVDTHDVHTQTLCSVRLYLIVQFTNIQFYLTKSTVWEGIIT